MNDDEIKDACWVAAILGALVVLIGSITGTARGADMATPELSSSGTPDAVNQILIGYFDDAQARMRAIVENPSGRTQAAKEFRQSRAAAMGSQVDGILQRLKKSAASWVGSDQTFAAMVHDGAARADRQATEAGVRVEPSLAGRFDLVDEGAVAVFARDAAADLYGAADSMADRAKRVLRATAQQGLSEAQINKVLAGGVIDGTPAEAIRQLRDELKAIHGGTVRIKTKTGGTMEFDVRKYAELVARTKTRQAVETARHERLVANGIELVAVIGRQSPSFCTAFLGQVFTIGKGGAGKYPPLSSLPGGGPPFHPNCSKSTRPFVEALAGEQQKQDAQILPDARKLIGMDVTQAQRAYKDLQLQSQVKDRYADTESKLYPPAA